MALSPKSERKNNKNLSSGGISSLYVRGFKSLSEGSSIEVRPLTILAGANSSGKSSIMQPLLMMKQTLEATYDPGALLIDGPHVRFTSVEQFLSKCNQKNVEEFEIGLDVKGEKGGSSIREIFRTEKKKGIEIVEARYEYEYHSVSLRPEMTHEEIISAVPHLKSYMNESYVDAFKTMRTYERLEARVRRMRCFLDAGLFTIEKDKTDLIFSTIHHFNEPFESHIRRLIHVPALRGNPERTYKTTAIGTKFSGTFENYVASIINHWQVSEDPRLQELGRLLEMLGLTWKVHTKQVDDTRVELRVGRLPARKKARDLVNIADVGFGVSQSLPVLVALLAAEAGQLVYIEQPEIHLHPRAQTAMAQVLADAANRGIRVVVETHSELLLLGVQTLVAEGKLSPEMVKLHWFELQDDGTTKINSADLDEAGAFGDWPEDFADTELEMQSRYLDAVESRLGTG